MQPSRTPRPHLHRAAAAACGRAADAGNGPCFAGWRVDLAGSTLRAGDGTSVHLTAGGFSLLRAFVEHPGRMLSRDRLRRRLGSPDLIRTVRSAGYMVAVQPTAGR